MFVVSAIVRKGSSDSLLPPMNPVVKASIGDSCGFPHGRWRTLALPIMGLDKDEVIP